jgi:hypothetical protein
MHTHTRAAPTPAAAVEPPVVVVVTITPAPTPAVVAAPEATPGETLTQLTKQNITLNSVQCTAACSQMCNEFAISLNDAPAETCSSTPTAYVHMLVAAVLQSAVICRYYTALV